MKSATLIVVAEIVSTKLVSGARSVEKPKDVGGPVTPTIPLHLARISAKTLLTLRGDERKAVQFYCWVWASGSHGGPRLFNSSPGSIHIFFLREDEGYLRTVGDYPAYDLEVPARWLPVFRSEWKSGETRTDLFERIATIRLRTELESLKVIPQDYWRDDMWDLIGLTSPFFIASKLDSYCRQFANPFGQFAACDATAREFEGRCLAYRLAREADSKGTEASILTKRLNDCEARTADIIKGLRSRNWPLPLFDIGWSQSPERHRLAMRLYASAMDSDFHNAACEAASTMPDARDLPECSSQP